MSVPAELYLNDPLLADRVAALLAAPAELLLPERLLIYSLVRGLAPRRCLEIGAHFGGSTVVITAALDDIGAGTLVSVDPAPAIPPEVWSGVSHRTTLLRGFSPACLLEARELAGGPFDFAFIDGDHTRAGVLADIRGVIDVVTPGAHLLFHDSHYWEVAEAIDEFLSEDGSRVADAGTLSTHSTPAVTRSDGKTERWGGLRMLRVLS
jgi:hypothetical protein